jgi:hypothetical protein
MTKLASAIGLVATLGGTARLAAQHGAIVAGLVSDAEGHRPIVYAQVRVLGTSRITLTDTSGAFHLADVPLGTQSLLIRAIGYHPVRIDLTLEAGDSLLLDPGILALQAFAIELPAVTARGDAAQLPALTRAGFYERRARGFGAFAAGDEISRWYPRTISDILRHLPGVGVVANPNYMRSSPRIDLRPYLIQLRGCSSILIFLNGVSVGSAADPDFSLDLVADAMDVSAVEVYRGPSEIPLQFNATNSLCGAVVIWTEH